LECATQVLFFAASQNLTTRVDALEFNHDGQILALASRMKKDALKMVWIGSTTVCCLLPSRVTSLRQALYANPFVGYQHL
jgi:U3 small nucleolar RNA-associated protein 18